MARFEVRCTNGSLFASPTTAKASRQVQAVWCEFLSLATLRKEVEQVIVHKGPQAAVPSQLHSHSPTLYVHAVPCGLPVPCLPALSTHMAHVLAMSPGTGTSSWPCGT